MKILAVKAVGLRGATSESGWSQELGPDDVAHTLVAVHTDEGLGVAVGEQRVVCDLQIHGLRRCSGEGGRLEDDPQR